LRAQFTDDSISGAIGWILFQITTAKALLAVVSAVRLDAPGNDEELLPRGGVV